MEAPTLDLLFFNLLSWCLFLYAQTSVTLSTQLISILVVITKTLQFYNSTQKHSAIQNRLACGTHGNSKLTMVLLLQKLFPSSI